MQEDTGVIYLMEAASESTCLSGKAMPDLDHLNNIVQWSFQRFVYKKSLLKKIIIDSLRFSRKLSFKHKY